MKIAVRVGKAAALCALALPATLLAQASGVSHPEDVPVATSAEGIQQPIVYERAAENAAPAKRMPTPVGSTFTVVGPPTALPADAPMPASWSGSTRTTVSEPTPTIPAKPDIDAGIVTRVAGPANQLPVGTLVKIKLGTDLSTKTTTSGTEFSAELTEAVSRDGRVMLPAGTVVSGLVTDIHGGRRVSGAANIHLRPTTLTLPDGTKYAFHSQVIDTNLYRETKVDREGTIWRRDHAAKTTATFALTTGSVAAAGAVFGGVPGALIGAGVGAGVSTAVWLKQDRQTDLPVGTKITLSLTQPFSFGGQTLGAQ